MSLKLNLTLKDLDLIFAIGKILQSLPTIRRSSIVQVQLLIFVCSSFEFRGSSELPSRFCPQLVEGHLAPYRQIDLLALGWRLPANGSL